MIGKKISHYNVTEKLGAGGMGEVYRATDTKLNRDVALKVLPEEFARDTDRMARFKREAQVLASLNHPNIAAIYGLEEDQGKRALVLELVEGPTLAERIAAGPLPLKETLEIARQIAEALEAAHEKGIIHRDLKPANVKVKKDGSVKVLDFGLAKALESPQSEADIANSPTLSVAATRAGMILGTAAYMSPEQAHGRQADKRADIWSFGVVLYEMLTGRQAFSGESISDTLASVLKLDPDWDALPSDTPAPIRKLLRRCLNRDRKRRLQAIGEARIGIEEFLENPVEASVLMSASGVATKTQPGWKRALPWMLAGAAVLLSALSFVWQAFTPSGPSLSYHLSIPLPPNEIIDRAFFSTVALSPDGTRLVYTGSREGTTHLFLRHLDRFDSSLIPGTGNALNPFFSPDGEWIAFFAGDKLKKVPLAGGAPITICATGTAVSDTRGGSWGGDGLIYFSPTARPDMGIQKVPASGGTPEPLTIPDPEQGEGNHRWPYILPGTRYALATIEKPGRPSFDDANIALVSLDTGERRTLIEGGMHARYSPSGHVLYGHAGTLFAAPFDINKLEVTGPAAAVLEGVVTSPATGAGQFDISQQGTLVFVPGEAGHSMYNIVKLDRRGNPKVLPIESGPYAQIALSPDGNLLALQVVAGDDEIWLQDLRRGTLSRLTFGAGDHTSPLWTPDGKRLTFSASPQGPMTLFWQAIDSGGEVTSLLKTEYFHYPGSWSPDGKLLAYTEQHPVSQQDIWVLPVEGEKKPELFVQTSFDEFDPQFSPDGKSIAYVSTASGRSEIYVAPHGAAGRRWQISTRGGQWPRWSRSGKELFFVTLQRELMRVPVETSPSFAPGRPSLLFKIPPQIRLPVDFNAYAVTPGGDGFIFVEGNTALASSQINVVLNWSKEISRVTRKGTN